jgi:hypothetical protein
MSEFVDLDQVVEDAVNDAVQPAEVETEVQTDTPSQESAEVTSPASGQSEDSPAVETAPTPEDPAAPVATEDPFEKQFGISAKSVTGNENRIPYSRVKKIVGTAEKKARETLEKEFTPRIQEYETKVKSYEQKLDRVAKFEEMMTGQPEVFLERLAELPVYKPFFQAVEALIARYQSGDAGTPADTPVEATDDMPAPNKVLPDGSAVYDMDGLRNLLSWNAKQTEDRVRKQIETSYGPIREEWETERQIRAVVPQIRAQLAEARTWPMFVENEEEITKVLQSNPQATLEAAYRHVVFPKIAATRDTIRQDVLKELQSAPRATATPTAQTKPAPKTSSGPRDLEDVIREAIGQLPR